MLAPSDAAERLAPELAELGATPKEEDAGTTDSDAAPRRALLAGRRARAALCAAGVAALCGLLALGGAGRSRRPRHSLDSGSEVVSLGGIFSAIGDVLEKTADGIEQTEEGYESVLKIPGQVSNVSSQLAGGQPLQSVVPYQRLVATGPLIEALQNGTFSTMLQSEASREELKRMLKKPNDLHDGNFCEDDEEEHASLCYKRCSLLTGGAYPVRSTAFSCCKSLPCTLTNSKATSLLKVCQGFDISGDKANNACPHQRGGCFADEDLHLDICYKKCALLTNGTYSWRSGAETCCKYKGGAPCLEANSTVTSGLFGVGGGEFEDLSAFNLTQGMTHPPLVAQTEVP